jgi:selenocysteine lyase/cysteine desulfurase
VARAASLGLRAPPAYLPAGHFLALRLPGGAPAGLPERLAKERAYVSLRGDSVRVTPHLYNNDADVDRLFGVLERAL